MARECTLPSPATSCDFHPTMPSLILGAHTTVTTSRASMRWLKTREVLWDGHLWRRKGMQLCHRPLALLRSSWELAWLSGVDTCACLKQRVMISPIAAGPAYYCCRCSGHGFGARAAVSAGAINTARKLRLHVAEPTNICYSNIKLIKKISNTTTCISHGCSGHGVRARAAVGAGAAAVPAGAALRQRPPARRRHHPDHLVPRRQRLW